MPTITCVEDPRQVRGKQCTLEARNLAANRTEEREGSKRQRERFILGSRRGTRTAYEQRETKGHTGICIHERQEENNSLRT